MVVFFLGLFLDVNPCTAAGPIGHDSWAVPCAIAFWQAPLEVAGDQARPVDDPKRGVSLLKRLALTEGANTLEFPSSRRKAWRALFFWPEAIASKAG